MEFLEYFSSLEKDQVLLNLLPFQQTPNPDSVGQIELSYGLICT